MCLLGLSPRPSKESTHPQPTMASDGSMPSLESIMAGVDASTFKQAARSAYSDMMGFYHAVDWAEPWLLGLGAFHLFIWILAIATYRWNDFQMVLLTLTCALPCTNVSLVAASYRAEI